jgi:hypothetical protein
MLSNPLRDRSDVKPSDMLVNRSCLVCIFLVSDFRFSVGLRRLTSRGYRLIACNKLGQRSAGLFSARGGGGGEGAPIWRLEWLQILQKPMSFSGH